MLSDMEGEESRDRDCRLASISGEELSLHQQHLKEDKNLSITQISKVFKQELNYVTYNRLVKQQAKNELE